MENEKSTVNRKASATAGPFLLLLRDYGIMRQFMLEQWDTCVPFGYLSAVLIGAKFQNNLRLNWKDESGSLQVCRGNLGETRA